MFVGICAQFTGIEASGTLSKTFLRTNTAGTFS